MSIKRFFAKTTRDALHMVRDALGPDGVILSNRAVDGGIEILALGPDDITALMPPSVEHAGGSVSSPCHEESREKSGNLGHTIIPSLQKNFLEREVKASTGDRDVRELPRLHFPSFDRKQDQSTKQWAIPVLTTEYRPTRESAPQEALAVPDRVSENKNPRPVFSSRLMTAQAAVQPEMKSAMQAPAQRKDLRADQGLDLAAKQVAKQLSKPIPNPVSDPVSHMIAPVEGSVISESASSGKKRRSAGNSREVADEVAASVLREIKSMRGTLEQQLAALTWNDQQRRDPTRGQVLRQLLSAGFSASLAYDLLDRMPAGQTEEDAMSWVKAILASNLKTIGSENEILENGGVYALVGPTGVGKTTTTAKLAARCVVRHGADKLALLTTDGYRIGGHEQLRIYGKILGVTVYAVKDTQDLALALAELRGKHMVLIDTVGMGQRDRMVAEQAAMLAGCGTEVKRLLLLNAASSAETLEEVARAYQGGGLAGAIITKLDEAVTTGCALDTAICHQLPLYFTATGQRVPEDLHLADSRHLINSAFNNLPAASPFAVPDEALPLLMAGLKGGAANLNMIGASLG
ncbi:MAG: flagellar biosynthesis protein FlhF [Nitrosospira sp.]|nr:flagellar biosynthesis protein FlhF [Nitrosospira sp.]